MTIYRIVKLVNGRWDKYETNNINAYCSLRSVEITGYNSNPRQRAELQGQPFLKDHVGPFWDGDAVRYENKAANDILSR